MLFNSLTFIVFFLIVLLLHDFPFPWKVKKCNLLVASYIFYAAWSPPFVILLWVVTLIDWFVAKWMANTEIQAKRKFLLVLSLVSNLGILSYFKYGDFLLNNFIYFARTFGIQYQPAELGIVLPIGISFYTFVTLSYTIDVYRKKIVPAKSFLDYALLVTFFPHLVAGPILRASQFLPQCLTPKKANAGQLGWGLALLVIGLFEKVVLADGISAPVADAVFSMKGGVSWVQGWLGMFAFTTQVFLDFSGYSLCAIGAALCLGFTFPDNFRFPFAAVGFRDLWRRWHITLSLWFRDYVYVSLGGDRDGTIGTLRNLFITMALAGLWHGAAWNYVIWGWLNGVFLIGEYVLITLFSGFVFFRTKAAQVGLMLLTFLLFNLSLVLFRSLGVQNALVMYKSMFSGTSVETILYSGPQAIGVIITTIGLVLFHWVLRNSSYEEAVSRIPWWITCFILVFMLLCIILTPGESNAFIYFQF